MQLWHRVKHVLMHVSLGIFIRTVKRIFLILIKSTMHSSKGANVDLRNSWASEEEICRCFASHVTINGQRVSFGVEESIPFAKKAIFQGMTKEDGTPKDSLSWLEEIVVLMRAVTSGKPFNHEWWADQINKPEWTRQLDHYYRDSWFYFPESPEELNAHNLGSKLGYTLSLNERRLELATTQPAFLEKMESVDLERARRGFEPEEVQKVRVVLSGYDNWKQYAEDAHSGAIDLRKTITQIVNERATREEAEDFSLAYGLGAK